MVGFPDFFAILPMHIIKEGRIVRWMADRSSKDPKHLIGPINRFGLKIAFPTPDLGQALCLSQPALTYSKLFLEQLAVSQVNTGTDEAGELASVVEGDAAVEKPAIFT